MRHRASIMSAPQNLHHWAIARHASRVPEGCRRAALTVPLALLIDTLMHLPRCWGADDKRPGGPDGPDPIPAELQVTPDMKGGDLVRHSALRTCRIPNEGVAVQSWLHARHAKSIHILP
jgi:hypothetical protein